MRSPIKEDAKISAYLEPSDLNAGPLFFMFLNLLAAGE